MPLRLKHMYIYKIAKFIPFIALWSCLQSSPPPSASNASQKSGSDQVVYQNAMKSVKYIDARSIYTLKIDGLDSRADKITFTFMGRSMPTLTIYDDEIKRGKLIKLISPSYKLRDLVIESSSNNKTLGQQVIRLKKTSVNKISI